MPAMVTSSADGCERVAATCVRSADDFRWIRTGRLMFAALWNHAAIENLDHPIEKGIESSATAQSGGLKVHVEEPTLGVRNQ